MDPEELLNNLNPPYDGVRLGRVHLETRHHDWVMVFARALPAGPIDKVDVRARFLGLIEDTLWQNFHERRPDEGGVTVAMSLAVPAIRELYKKLPAPLPDLFRRWPGR